VFTPIAVDNHGNLFVAFSMQQRDLNGTQTGQNVYLIWSKDGGQTWSKALQMNNPADPATATGMLPWLTAGDRGQVSVFWYGTDVVGDPNNESIFANAKWKLFYALADTATSTPSVQYVVASGTATGTADQMAGVVHYGSICTQGLNCNTAVPPGNRELAEYSELTHDPLGMIHMSFSEDNPSLGSAFTWYTKQTAGPGLLPNVGSGAGYFNIGSGTGNFGLLVESHALAGTTLREGTLTYLDTSKNIVLSDTRGFSKVQILTNAIQVSGTGTLQDGSSVNFTATATAGGPGSGQFAISWAGYSASGTLVQGQVIK
jgi:cold shock CspA family protein